VINALIGAANDGEPMVRALAVQSLGEIPGDRTTAVIASHLPDAARIVRARAAEALLDRGIVQLEGAPGAALTRAQDDWAASLRTFNDSARDQSRLGWLELSRGRADAARAALETAIRVDPADPQPHVYLGVAAARAGRFDDALKQFTAARSLKRDYPNIDRLIEEAQKRR
jgi:tetratricopeptide (TPR) repeat protein